MKPRIHTTRSGSAYRLTVEAPQGYVWTAGYVHELVVDGRGPNTVAARQELTKRMACGLEPCDIVDCDWCNGN